MLRNVPGKSIVMEREKCIEILERKGVRVTSIRILVMEALIASSCPMSLSDLEIVLDTVDKSSIFRTLEVFDKHHIVHSIDDGTGSVKFEVCEGEDDCTIADMHAHFYCEKCHRTFCLKDVSAPLADLPEGFSASSVNYIIKGICPECRSICIE